MKLARYFVMVGILAVSCSMALADSTNDPIFKLGPGGQSQTVGLDGSFSFSFTQTQSCSTDSTCTAVFDFINDTGKFQTSLNLFLSSASGLSFSCGDNSNDPYFTNCSSVFDEAAGGYDISFFGLDVTHWGIPFAILTNCGNGWEWEDYDADNQGSNCQVLPHLADFSLTADVSDMSVDQSFSGQGQLGGPVPEPSSLILLAVGGMLVLLLGRRGVIAA
ncbi:MAG TPA: PEP-CTERM sorting domain-containing protein [Candidatus Eisenbacteria bacterium]|nr:PEP-CTERM sorting domain-containing protein [Candidatus Eisenbacteria bacterium]